MGLESIRQARRSLALKIVGLAVLSVSLTIAYFGLVSYRVEYQSQKERAGHTLDRIVATAVLAIDGAAHRRIKKSDDAGTPEFVRIRDYLRKVQLANSLREDQIYTFALDPQLVERVSAGERVTLHFAVMLQEKSFIGDAYQVVPQNLAALRQALLTGQAAHTDLYSDANGTYISAYAPIRDGNGAISGVLEVDYDVHAFLMAVERSVRRLVLISLVGLLVSTLLATTLANGITRALRSIRESAEAIAGQDYSRRIELSRNDELGLVAQQFNQMAETLAQRFLMLKYLPQHTLESIEQRTQSGIVPITKRVFGAVLFTDIRGFTALSNQVSDVELVQILNLYLAKQAEIIEAHGGVIDKFIGDAVLALFMGGGRCRRAVEAALSIRKALLELHESTGRAQVHVGLGIAAGELVLGEIGSEARRERTPLGPVVNLASRLSSAAGSEEILVSDFVYNELGADLQVSASRGVALKGFTTTQVCHSVEAIAPAQLSASQSRGG